MTMEEIAEISTPPALLHDLFLSLRRFDENTEFSCD